MIDIVYYENKERVNEILENKNEYVILEINECTEKALAKKCDFILNNKKNKSQDWKPLLLEYKHGVHMFIKKFYLKIK